MKQFSLIIFILVLFLSCAETKSNSTYLIPYRKGKLWGLSDENKKIIVSCHFNMCSRFSSFYILGDEKKDYLYSSKGVLLDSATEIAHVDSRRILLVNSVNYSININKLQSEKMEMSQQSRWVNIPPSKLKLLDTNGKKDEIQGVAKALLFDKNLLAFVEIDNKQGIYNIDSGRFTIPIKYDSIRLIPPKFLVCYSNNQVAFFDERGKSYSFSEQVLTADYTDTTTLNYYKKDSKNQNLKTLYSSKGVMLLDTSKMWDYSSNAIIIRNKPGTSDPHFFMNLADKNGKIIIENAMIEGITGTNYFKIKKRRNGNPYIGLWDSEKNKWSFQFDEKSRVDFRQDVIEVESEDNYNYYSYSGKPLGKVGSSRFTRNENSFFKELNVYDFNLSRTPNYRKRFIAIKENPQQPFLLYDHNGDLINKKFDDLIEAGQVSPYLTCRIKDKWGLIDRNMKEIIPAIYDTFIYSPLQNYLPQLFFVVKKDGKRYYTDTTGKILFSGKWFSHINDKPFENKWLAFDYKPHKQEYLVSYTEVIEKMYVIDSLGNVKKEWKIEYPDNPYYTPDYQFNFTTTGKILKSINGNDMNLPCELYDTKSNSVKKVPYDVHFLRELDNKILLLECTNKDEEMGLINASDFSVVVPFGQYTHFYTEGYSLPNGETALLIIGENELSEPKTEAEKFNRFLKGTDKEKTPIGIYTKKGISYWDK